MQIRWIPCIAALATFLAPHRGASAHDYWLEPERVRGTGKISVRLFLGASLATGKEKAAQKRRISSLRLVTPRGENDLLEAVAEGKKPLLELERRATGGGALLALERTPARITLDHVKFNNYLREEALVKVILERTHARQMHRAGREVYTRYLKLYLPGRTVASARAALATRPVGHRLELVLDADPASFRTGQSFVVRAFFENEPLPGVTIALSRRPPSGEVTRSTLVTDADGRAVFPIAGGGLHVLRLVHMRRFPGDPTDFQQPEWESFWTSFAFPVKSRAGR